MKEYIPTAFIPTDSDYIFEIVDEQVFKVHKSLFDSKDKKVVQSSLSSDELEEYLPEIVDIMTTKLYKLLNGDEE